MADTTKNCLEWSWKAQQPDQDQMQTDDCTKIGLGCINPTKDDGTESCTCNAQAGYTPQQGNNCGCDSAAFFTTLKNGSCACAVGYGNTGNEFQVTCVPCTGTQYKTTASNAPCGTCPTNSEAVDSSGNVSQQGPNVRCKCSNANFGLLGSDSTLKCVSCNGTGQAITDGVCMCSTGYTQDTATGTCTKESTSSASPLAIILICVFLLAFIVSAVAVVAELKRKIIARRTTKTDLMAL